MRMTSAQLESMEASRQRCAACFKQFNKMEYLIEHMKVSFHSQHEPICEFCKKHFRFYESLREHLVGSLPKAECAKHFTERGCSLCLKIFKNSREVTTHMAKCRYLPTPSYSVGAGGRPLGSNSINSNSTGSSAIALDCQLVGGGQDGSLDLCARVCLVDEQERVIFDSFVKPLLPITDYRYDVTGLQPNNMIHAMPLRQVQEMVEEILYNGEAKWKARLDGGRAKRVVGHNLKLDLECLSVDYPPHLIRDTSKYTPLLKSSKASNSLKYLTSIFLGYKIQRGKDDPYENCVAAMRLYKKMQKLDHSPKEQVCAAQFPLESALNRLNNTDLGHMTPEALLKISHSDYYCWCLD